MSFKWRSSCWGHFQRAIVHLMLLIRFLWRHFWNYLHNIRCSKFFFTDFLASTYSLGTIFSRNYIDFLKTSNPFKASVTMLQYKSVDWFLRFGDNPLCVNLGRVVFAKHFQIFLKDFLKALLLINLWELNFKISSPNINLMPFYELNVSVMEQHI